MAERMEEKRDDNDQTIDTAVSESDANYLRLRIDHSWGWSHLRAAFYGGALRKP